MAVRTSRLDQMEEYIRKHDFVPLDDLCVAFQRSKITIRRDLSMLEEKGVIEKVYGGARPRHRDIGRPVASFTERNICLTDQKQYIGKLAAQHVNDGDTLYIDSGTTTLTMLPYLAERSVTILSNNLYVIMLLSVLSPTKVSVTPLRKLMPVVPIKAFVILKRLSSAGSSTVKDAVFTFRRPPKEITLIWG